MALYSLMVLHMDHGQPRFYDLIDLNKKEGRPYYPHTIEGEEMPDCWVLINPRTGLKESHHFYKPVAIDRDNVITVYSSADGQPGKAISLIRKFLKKMCED